MVPNVSEKNLLLYTCWYKKIILFLILVSKQEVYLESFINLLKFKYLNLKKNMETQNLKYF